MLKISANLMYKYYSGEMIEGIDCDNIPEDIQALSEKIIGENIFSEDYRFPDCSITSIFSHLFIGPDPPIKTFYSAKPIDEDNIYFPSVSSSEKKINNKISEEIKNSYERIKDNPDALLMLIQKYGTFIPIKENSPISFYEHIKFLEAIRQCNNHFLIMSADFSGIQNFIYTISSKGALKSLRARSFFLSLISEHIIYEILKNEKLNRSSIIYSGGGSLLLLLPKSSEKNLQKLKEKINSYLLNIGGKLYLGLVWSECQLNDLIPPKFRFQWEKLEKLLEEDKNNKFTESFEELFSIKMPKKLTTQEECQICHRDDIDSIENIEDKDGNKLTACHLCKEFFYLGDALTDYNYINRWDEKPSEKNHFIRIPSLSGNAYFWVDEKHEGNFSWIKNSFQPGSFWPFLTADYVTKNENKTADFKYLADNSIGKKLVACLRMDVDNFGFIFSNSLDYDSFSLPAISTLSKSLNMFFTIYMNLICKKQIDSPLLIPEKNRANKRFVSILYSGGDDLVIVGAWNEISEIAIDIRRTFRKYVGNKNDISISGSAFLAHPKFPLYQMINLAGQAQNLAKKNYNECKKEKCCQDYSQCIFFQKGDIPICRRKDSILFFYSPLREFKKKRINVGKNNDENYLKTALKWDEVEKKVVEPLKTMYPIFDVKKEEILFSRSLIYKLFSLIEKWENEGNLYLPLMHYTIEDLKKLSTKKSINNFAELSSILFNPKYMPYLYIPLVWMDLLKRKRR